MEPWKSWALFLTLCVAAYFYYSNQKKVIAHPARSQSLAEDGAIRSARKDTKLKRRPDAVPRGSDAVPKVDHAKGKRDLDPVPSAPVVPAQPETGHGGYDDVNDYYDDKDNEWARQLAKLRKGTALPPSSRGVGSGRRTVTQRVANNAGSDRIVASGSSTNGTDVDAESSPILSPALNASASGRDVSDMMEPSAIGPSVLRLTEATRPAVAKKQQPKASSEPKETKKQRQNRKKAELAKALRQDDEATRKLLMEQQRRTAREARGEPAMNGISAPAPASNAWAQKKSSETSGDVELLDTLAKHSPASATGAATASWERDLPSEEEQMRLAMEDSTWSTVATRSKRARKKNVPVEHEADRTLGVQSLPLTETTNTSHSDTMSSDVEPANSLEKPVDTNDYVQGQAGSHPQDSDWAVV